ncbi:hypothetical protein THAR02_07589 [Trichoderma harzianum]|uniref:Clr5 domain-containing protein n=1 Tax=Trichoderma harzianum TaxID=5544 RepID=A0A0F9X6W4_TRIHA|nr:hypothetical protein THAR02_07589 [Trichoderma harzianum]
MEIDDLLPRSDEDKYCRLPFAERLEKLKPIIVKLYMGNYGHGGKRMVMRQVVEFMKDKYSFHMAQNQLEYALRKWNVRRRILNREKDDVAVVLGKRTHAGTSISDVTLQKGKPVDEKQLKRYLQDKIRRYVAEPMVPGVLSTWNLPYRALKNSIIRQPDIASPFRDTCFTPNYITVNSPDTAGMSPLAMASPSMRLIRQRFRQDLSNLLLQGQFKNLFKKCSEEDRIVLTDYMHEFWIHTFVTAKYWGRGPLLWTTDMIAELTLSPSVIPSSAATTPASCFAPSPLSPQDEATFLPTPSQHCRWVIHVTHQQQYASKEEDKMTTKSSHPLEEPWSLAEYDDHSFPQSMQQSITESTFTSLSPEHLPVSNSLIAESLRTAPSSLQLESLRFAIMAGNIELVESLLVEGMEDPSFIESLKETYPYHLAVSYLDGGNTCCSLLTTLFECIEDFLLYDHIRALVQEKSAPALLTQMRILEKKEMHVVDGMQILQQFAGSFNVANTAFHLTGNIPSVTALFRLFVTT